MPAAAGPTLRTYRGIVSLMFAARQSAPAGRNLTVRSRHAQFDHVAVAPPFISFQRAVMSDQKHAQAADRQVVRIFDKLRQLDAGKRVVRRSGILIEQLAGAGSRSQLKPDWLVRIA